MTEFFSINRYALITRPSPALIKWVNTIFPDDPVDYADIEGERHDQMDVFLIPEFDDMEDAFEDECDKENQSFLSLKVSEKVYDFSGKLPTEIRSMEDARERKSSIFHRRCMSEPQYFGLFFYMHFNIINKQLK